MVTKTQENNNNRNRDFVDQMLRIMNTQVPEETKRLAIKALYRYSMKI